MGTTTVNYPTANNIRSQNNFDTYMKWHSTSSVPGAMQKAADMYPDMLDDWLRRGNSSKYVTTPSTVASSPLNLKSTSSGLTIGDTMDVGLAKSTLSPELQKSINDARIESNAQKAVQAGPTIDNAQTLYGTKGVDPELNVNMDTETKTPEWGMDGYGGVALGVGQLGLGVASYLENQKTSDLQRKLLQQQYDTNKATLADKKQYEQDKLDAFGLSRDANGHLVSNAK